MGRRHLGRDLREHEPRERGHDRRLPALRRRGRRPRGCRREGGLRGLAPRAGAEARRDPVPLRTAAERAKGRPGSADGARDGEGAAGGARGRPGSDRHGLLHGRRGPPALRTDDALRAPRQVQHERAPADRGRGRDHALELPDRDSVLEDPARARLRGHGRLQACDRHTDARRALRGAARGSGRAARRRQRRPRRWGRGRHRDRHPPGRARDHAHGLPGDWCRGHEGRGRPPEARSPRARRQERDHRPRRRRARPGGRGHHLVGLRHLGSALHRGEPRDRARGCVRPAGLPPRQRGREAPAGRRLGGGHGRGPGHQQVGAREDPLVHRNRTRRGRDALDRRRSGLGRRARQGFLLPADDLRRRRSRDAHRPGGDLRPDDGRDQGSRHRRGDPGVERDQVRALLVDLHPGRQPGLPRNARSQGGHHLHQRRHDRGRGAPAVRRRQGHGQRPPRGGPGRARLLHRVEVDLRRLLGQAA